MSYPNIPNVSDFDYVTEHYSSLVVTAALLIAIVVTAALFIAPAFAIGIQIARWVLTWQ